MEPTKKKLTNQNKKTIAYNAKKLFTTIGPAIYLVYMAGGFSGEYTTTGLKSVFTMVPLIVLISYARDGINYIKDKKNQNNKAKAVGKALVSSIPWAAVVGIVFAITIGLTGILQHILVICGMQIGGSVILGFEEYYALEIKKAQGEADVAKAVQLVSKTMTGGGTVV